MDQHNHQGHNHQANNNNRPSSAISSGAIYTCPMHPEVKQSKPGMCSECGMQLIPTKPKLHPHETHDDFNKHQGHSTNIFKIKFWVSLVLSIPIVAYSDIAQKLVGFKAPTFFGSGYLPFALSSVIFFYGGWIFIA